MTVSKEITIFHHIFLWNGTMKDVDLNIWRSLRGMFDVFVQMNHLFHWSIGEKSAFQLSTI